MSNYAYNPITGQLDLVGGGASYIDGVVADSSLLPVTLGTPALDSVFLAKAGSGLWLISRRPAGLYVRVANNGVAADWTYLGSFPEVNADANWELYNSTDPTKELKFDLSGLPTSTVRTVGAPAGNGQMMVSGQAGSFTTLTANNGTVTTSAPALTLSQTWNASAQAFHLCTIGITNSTPWTASAASSTLFRVQFGGSNAFAVGYTGNCTAASLNTTGGLFTNGPLQLSSNVSLQAGTGQALDAWTGGALDVRLWSVGNPATSATNFERLFLRGQTGGAFLIGTEKGGTGAARDLELQSDGITRMRISGTPRVFGGLINYAGSITGAATIGIGTFGYLSGTAGNSGGLSFYNGSGGGIGARFGTEEDFVLAMRNAGNSHSLRIYNTHTSTTSWERLNLRWASNEFILDAEAGSGGGTLRGIKIGSATSSLLGFYGATPVDRPATVADPAGGGTVDTEARTAINDIIDRLQELGLIA